MIGEDCCYDICNLSESQSMEKKMGKMGLLRSQVHIRSKSKVEEMSNLYMSFIILFSFPICELEMKE